jgi:acid stress-induced BolA-like protein IbaG/YrbA
MQDEVRTRVEAAIPEAQVAVEVDGNRAVIAVTSNYFDGMSRVKSSRQYTLALKI